MSGTLILRCSCINRFQDEEYGKGLRVHNRTKKSDGSVYRCTACTQERPVNSPKQKVVEK